VCKLVKADFVELIPLRTHKMVAVAFTKSLPSLAFIGHRRVMMGQTPFALKFWHSECVCLFVCSNISFYFFPLSFATVPFLDGLPNVLYSHTVHGGERYNTCQPFRHERLRERIA